MLANLPRDTKRFLTSLTRGGRQTLQVIRKNFPGRISSQPQECGVTLVTVTNEPVPRPSTLYLHFLGQNIFFFPTSWKYRGVPIWFKNLNPKRYAAKYRYRKGLDVYALAKRK